jgi:hypothetical protein
VARVVVQSRQGAEARWRQRASGLYYDVQVDGTRLRHQVLPLGRPVADRDWRLTSAPATVVNDETTVALGWRPHELRFVAQGEGPFVLAWGHPEARRPEDLAGLVRSLTKRGRGTATASLGDTVSLGGASVLAGSPEGLDWSRYALWGALVLAVAVVLSMARRLLQETGGDRD